MFKGLLAAAYRENSFSRFKLYCLCRREGISKIHDTM